MKVSELARKLGQLDPNLEVYCYAEGPVAIQGPGPFDLVDASEADVDVKRIDGKPSMSFVGTGKGRKVVVIGITPDF
jgi:hypothetical protein